MCPDCADCAEYFLVWTGKAWCRYSSAQDGLGSVISSSTYIFLSWPCVCLSNFLLSWLSCLFCFGVLNEDCALFFLEVEMKSLCLGGHTVHIQISPRCNDSMRYFKNIVFGRKQRSTELDFARFLVPVTIGAREQMAALPSPCSCAHILILLQYIEGDSNRLWRVLVAGLATRDWFNASFHGHFRNAELALLWPLWKHSVLPHVCVRRP